jgi:hypothetical protein
LCVLLGVTFQTVFRAQKKFMSILKKKKKRWQFFAGGGKEESEEEFRQCCRQQHLKPYMRPNDGFPSPRF